jgi:ABC-type multidrug transport system permease subunit
VFYSAVSFFGIFFHIFSLLVYYSPLLVLIQYLLIIMKSILCATIAASTLVAATPVSRDIIDTSFDMDDGSIACASTAVIFARGTFDSGYADLSLPSCSLESLSNMAF